MAELRQRKVGEPQKRALTNAEARSLDTAAKRPRRSDKESGLLLFATPLIVFLHIASVSTLRAVVSVFLEAGHLGDPVCNFAVGGP